MYQLADTKFFITYGLVFAYIVVALKFALWRREPPMLAWDHNKFIIKKVLMGKDYEKNSPLTCMPALGD